MAEKLIWGATCNSSVYQSIITDIIKLEVDTWNYSKYETKSSENLTGN